MKLTEIEAGQKITLQITNDENKELVLDASIQRFVRDNVAVIALHHNYAKRLTFDNVQIDMIYMPEGDMPYIWRNVKILFYQSFYLLQVVSDGLRNNRRSFFRVDIYKPALLKSAPSGPHQIMVRDISLSGFSVYEKNNELILSQGDEIVVFWEDLGCKLTLRGRVVRQLDQNGVTVYGLKICNICDALSYYINAKQLKKK